MTEFEEKHERRKIEGEMERERDNRTKR